MSTTSTADSSANSRQVGGDHYKGRAIEHWDFIVSWGNPYLEGCITKYVARWRDKGGLQDLEKAGHYLDKLIEEAPKLAERALAIVSAGCAPDPGIPGTDFCDAQGLADRSYERAVILAVTVWLATGADGVLLQAKYQLGCLLAQAKAAVAEPAPRLYADD